MVQIVYVFTRDTCDHFHDTTLACIYKLIIYHLDERCLFIMELGFSPIVPMKFGEEQEVGLKKSDGGGQFQNILRQAIDQTNQLAEIAQQDSTNLALGTADDLVQVQINSLKAKTMLQTTVQLTTKAVNAYKEIMQMQV